MHQKKPRLRDGTDRGWFSRLLRHPARKRSGSILTTLELARGGGVRIMLGRGLCSLE